MTPPSSGRTNVRRWSLQARLMVTIIGVVSLIVVFISVATSAILGGVLESRLDQQLRSTMQMAVRGMGPSFNIAASAGATAILEAAPQTPGFLLAVESRITKASGAVVEDDGTITALTDDQLTELAAAITGPDPTTVRIDGFGAYRVAATGVDGAVAVMGLPRTEVERTIAEMLTTIALVTAGGLLLLAAATAFVIRMGLRPLRLVADTATRVAAMPMAEGAVSITERVPAEETDEHTEIGRVGHALNTLLDHVDESLGARQRNEERMRRFVADASHELRTPLASIRGYSELSLRALQHGGAPASGDTAAALERIQAQSLRMTALVEDLLLLARLDEGQELVYGSVDLTRLAIDAVADARPAGPDHRWVIDVDDTPIVVAGDATRLHQVIANLLANARTHTPPGTTVTTSIRHDGADAVLRVHDDGPGVDPAVADELFERFSRGDRSRARQTGGTGLGLSIAKAIVDAHHGAITVRSEEGDTTFTVRLPARPEAPRGRTTDDRAGSDDGAVTVSTR